MSKKEDVEIEAEDALVQSVRSVARAFAVTFSILFIGLSTCSITSHYTEKDRLEGDKLSYEGQAKLEEAKSKTELAKVEAEKEKNKAIVELIKSGVDPMSARCAIVGSQNTNDYNVCLKLVTPPPNGIGMVQDHTRSVPATKNDPIKPEAEQFDNLEDDKPKGE